ncbi:MAG: ATP-binding protein [Nitrospirae bacterium]|nr:ATP-binding protein [Nitrospirota bacterium]
MNPFLDTTAYIKHADKFFGREREIKEITDCLKKRQPCSVVGPRRIGKSSLLYHLKLTAVVLEAYTPVYIDCMGVLKKPRVFLKEIWGGLSNETCPDDIDALFDRLDGYLKDVKTDDKPNKPNKPPLLLLDEIEVIAISEFGDIFNWLRSKTSATTLNIITASKEELGKVFDKKYDIGSAFYNIFKLIPLGVMQEAEVRAMLGKLASPEFEAQCGMRIIQEVGTHPFLVQQLAALCYDRWQANEPLKEDTWGEILAKHDRDAEAYYKYTLSSMRQPSDEEGSIYGRSFKRFYDKLPLEQASKPKPVTAKDTDSIKSEPKSEISENGRRILNYLKRFDYVRESKIGVDLRLLPSQMNVEMKNLKDSCLVELVSDEGDWMPLYRVTKDGKDI